MTPTGSTTDKRAHTGDAGPGLAKVQGRFLAWTTLVVALAASVGANVAQAHPELGPRLTAAVAPTIVILASGLLERVSVTGARTWQRILVVGGLIFVVGAAFVTSFQHQYELLIGYGNEVLSAVLLPLAIDVLIVMASVCLAVIAERRRVLLRVAETVGETEFTPDIEPDIEPDTAGTDEQQQRGGRPLTPEQRAVRLWRHNTSRSAADIARELERRGITVSARQVARWLEPVRTPASHAEPVPADA